MEVCTLFACLTPQAGSRRLYSYPCKMQGLGNTFSFAPVPTPRLQKADGRPSTGATLPAYSVVQRPYGRCSPTVPFTALSSFLTPFGVGGESSFSNSTKASNSTPLRGVGLYPRFEKLLFSPSFFYKHIAGLFPACSCPACGENCNHKISPFSGMYLPLFFSTLFTPVNFIMYILRSYPF